MAETSPENMQTLVSVLWCIHSLLPKDTLSRTYFTVFLSLHKYTRKFASCYMPPLISLHVTVFTIIPNKKRNAFSNISQFS